MKRLALATKIILPTVKSNGILIVSDTNNTSAGDSAYNEGIRVITKSIEDREYKEQFQKIKDAKKELTSRRQEVHDIVKKLTALDRMEDDIINIFERFDH